ncbi:DUF397 domain-containing protein [Streptomyces coffeae]|uniref:DUF397 domain-containing protein n=1 Tax=Streptomyces coffeae TaxID=621382 RepID=A0ABS1N5W1_9ACTN|nr:DUF397 domain-containing protein [Streptomyces coffeae]MBL1095433.1 DUF397 domain-containing protein [Streptomyces coffeae]
MASDTSTRSFSSPTTQRARSSRPGETRACHSDTQGGACVEVAACPHTVHVRDSKQESGPQLTLTPTAWAEFIAFSRV